MDKILIVSDTHRKNENYLEIIKKCGPFDKVIHCGDVEGSEFTICEAAGCPVEMVMGNNDFFSNLPREKDIMSQTTEMLGAMISILIQGENKEIYAIMKHHTSYKFYQKLKQLGYVEELYWCSQMEEERPIELDRIVEVLKEKYDDLNEYFSDENREHFPEYAEYIFHDITFTVTDKFLKRYKKDSGKRLK